MARKSAEENRRNVLKVECRVGNATIYRQFPTKDPLATAYAGVSSTTPAAGASRGQVR